MTSEPKPETTPWISEKWASRVNANIERKRMEAAQGRGDFKEAELARYWMGYWLRRESANG